MVKKAVITIYQYKDDPDLKKMLKDLKKCSKQTNQYSNRSESEIAKMILQVALTEKHEQICGQE